MFPFKDNIPTERFPVITVLLVAVNIAVFIYELSLGPAVDGFITRYGMTPYEITQGASLYQRGGIPVYSTLITSMFLHAGWLHIIGNMLFLWIFGNNVEDSMGRIRFVLFYLMCGLIAGFAQIAIEPQSTIPNVGASGAIAGVLGGYLLLFPRARVMTLILLGFFITFFELPAVAVIISWFIIQLFSGTASLYSESAGGGVAYFAHIGGFISGLLAIKLFTRGKTNVYVKQQSLR